MSQDAVVFCIGYATGISIAYAVLSAIVMWLWNNTLPDLFGLNKVTFWQSVRLLLLVGILFGGRSCSPSSGESPIPVSSQSLEM